MVNQRSRQQVWPFQRRTPCRKPAIEAPHPYRHLQGNTCASCIRSMMKQSCTAHSGCVASGSLITTNMLMLCLKYMLLFYLPTGAPKAAETPAAAPADTKSRFSVSLRKYSKIYKHTQRKPPTKLTHLFIVINHLSHKDTLLL